jgi:O-antigen ligase
MMKRELEERVGFILAWGALAVCILVTDRVNSDPVNVSKMFLLSVIGFSLLPVLFIQRDQLLKDNRILVFTSLGFITVATVSIFSSANPIERGLYGAYGRNTGLVAYTALIIIFLASTLISEARGFQRVMKAFVCATVVNVVLSLLAASGNDILAWENPYNAPLGTFGNPNFISAFMGIAITFVVVQLLDQNLSARLRFLALGFLPFLVLTIYFSKALQGTLVAAFGSSLAIYFFMRSKENFQRLSFIYLGAVVSAGLVGLAGILNKGPLATYLYSSTVKFRGEYWKAGINMGMENPITGVGIDSYGIYYKTFRELSATVAPGVDVGTDTAHNVYIDIFSGTGFPGLTLYLIINGFVLLAAFKYLKSTRTFDGQFLTLFLCWAAYQLQTIASINQLGLAVWGWLFGGLIIAYTRSSANRTLFENRNENKGSKSGKGKKDQVVQLLDASTSLKILAGAVVGLLIALPPFVIDAKMRVFFAGKSGTAEDVIALGQSWPIDNLRLNRIVVSLANNNQNDQARELASFAALKFPNDFVSWWTLDQLTPDGIPEKEFIRAKIHEIDPYNPAYFKK